MGVTDQFLTYTITTLFPTSPRVWYMGLINNSPSPILGSGDTAAQIGGTNGWSEIPYNSGSAGYSQATRILWTHGVPSANAITNAVVIAFSMTASFSVYGAFLSDSPTGTSGHLCITLPFVGGPQSVVNTNTLNVTMTILGASS